MPSFWTYSHCPMITHTIAIDQLLLHTKSKQDKFKVTNLKNLPKLQRALWILQKKYKQPTFWSYLIRCVNM